MKTTWLMLLLAAVVYGSSLSGTWSGNIVVTDPSSGEKITTPVKAEFDQKDAAITGKIGRAHDQEPEPIKNGKVQGNNLVFEVQPPEATSPMKFNLVMVSEDRIEGDMKGAIDVGNISGKVILTRGQP